MHRLQQRHTQQSQVGCGPGAASLAPTHLNLLGSGHRQRLRHGIQQAVGLQVAGNVVRSLLCGLRLHLVHPGGQELGARGHRCC